jgi:SAM-dependent methyltransferase
VGRGDNQAMNRRAQVEALLATYPRPRPQLPPQEQAIFVEHYRSNRAGKRGLSRIVAGLESWMHRRVGGEPRRGALLELGAGNLNHVPYLPESCVCDAVEPFQELWQDSPYRSRIRRFFSDLRDIPRSTSYDCIFSIAVLEHLEDLPAILAGVGLLLREGGTFRAGFPSEGGLLWGLAWRLTTGVEYRLRHGLDYGVLMRHEHLNSANEILTLLGHFFREVRVSRFPLPFHHGSFYTTAIARRPYLDRCRSLDSSRSESGHSISG